jgi:hypothetical protein
MARRVSALYPSPVLFLFFLGVQVPSVVAGQSVIEASIGKVERFEQTGSSTVVAAGWDFRAVISFDSDPGDPVTISSPTTGPFSLGPDPIDPSGRAGTFSFATKADLDDDFPASTTYTFGYGSSSTYALGLGADDYPALATPPQFTGATFAAAQAIDPAQPFAIEFLPKNSAFFDFIGITYTEGGTRFPIDVVPDTDTQYTIDAGELPASSNLTINISYSKITGTGPGAFDGSGYTLETSMPAVTLIPEPSRAGWLLGAATLVATVLRRRFSGKMVPDRRAGNEHPRLCSAKFEN